MTRSPISSPLGAKELEATGKSLQDSLVDLIDLTLIAKQAHWNVLGTHFRSVHLQLDDLVGIARQYTDDVAERAATLGVSPDGRAATVAKHSGVPEFPNHWQQDDAVIETITGALATLIERFRQRIKDTDKTDLVTQDLFIEVTSKLEQAHWMWQAQVAKV